MRLCFSALLAAVLALAAPPPAHGASPNYFRPAMRPDDRIENVFSRAISSTVRTRSTAGYGTYHFRDARDGIAWFDGTYGFFGGPSGTYAGGIQFRGDAMYWVMGAKSRQDTDASGPVFNPWLWGRPPAVVRAGTAWAVRIPRAWEIGPAGTQTVKVLSIDPADERIVLERDGSGYGAPFAEKPPLVDGVRTAYGWNTWKGIAIVRRGIIESDAIVVHRQIVVPPTRTTARRTLVETEQVELQLVPPGATGSAGGDRPPG